MPRFIDISGDYPIDAAAEVREALGIDTVIPFFDAREYGVIADGTAHNNVANLLDCFAAVEAAGGGTVLLPPGVIDTSEADAWVTVTADSGNEYTNTGAIPIPADTPITVVGHGRANTTLKLSTGFPRAFDFDQPVTDAPVDIRDITLRDFTVDQDNLTGLDVGPLTAVTGNVTIPSGGTYVTLPGISAETFKDCRLVRFADGNSGTSAGLLFPARVSGGNFQVKVDGGTSYTVVAGDEVQGALRNHVIIGNYIDYGSVFSGRNTRVDNLLIERVDTINVTAGVSTTGLSSPDNADVLCNIQYSAQYFGLTSDDMVPSATRWYVKDCRFEGGNVGVAILGAAGTWVDDVWCIDVFHDTMQDYAGNWLASNFHFAQDAYMGRGGVIRCTGRRSGDVALEVDQPWEFAEVDCLWEESYSGVYSTSFQPPADNMYGPPTTTLGSDISGTWDGSSAITPTFGDLPDDVERSGICRIDSELFWYRTTNDAGTAVTLMRGFNGSSAAAHTTGATVTFIESEKTRVHSVRSTIRNASILEASGQSGIAFASYGQRTLPLPPMTITDATVFMHGGSMATAGQCIRQFGYRPEFRIEGLRFTHVGMGGSGAATNQFGSAMYFQGTSNMGSLYSMMRAPVLFGRNNKLTHHGVASSNYYYYTSLRTYSGYSRLDFDLHVEMAIRNAGSGRIKAVQLVGEGSAIYTLAYGSRIGLKYDQPSTVGSDLFSVGLSIGSSSLLNINGTLEASVDVSGQAFSSGANDIWYAPWRIDSTNADKVRFSRVRHSTSTTTGYPEFRVPTTKVTSNYTVTGRDSVIQVDSSGGAVTITLPGLKGGWAGGDGSILGQPLARGQHITIIDVGFAANTYNITVAPNAADKINNGTVGASTAISTNGGSLQLIAHAEGLAWITI